MGIKVLSLFDGISCGQVALEKAGIKVDTYYASEIVKNAIKVTQTNYPNTVQLGDIALIDDNLLDRLGKIDIVIGGSPCQDLSVYKHFRNDVKGLEGVKVLYFIIMSEYYNISNQDTFYWRMFQWIKFGKI